MSKSIARLKKSLATWERPHGTTSRYWQGCRCTPCRAAIANRVAQNQAERKAGRPLNPVVSANPARRHIKKLSRRGVGVRPVAEHSGIHVRTVFEIRAGRKRNIRAEGLRKILAVPPNAHADLARIPSGPTKRIIEELKEEGFTVTEIGRRIGVKDLRIGNGITALRALRIQQLYNRVMIGGEEIAA